jgi:hypothetical protein
MDRDTPSHFARSATATSHCGLSTVNHCKFDGRAVRFPPPLLTIFLIGGDLAKMQRNFSRLRRVDRIRRLLHSYQTFCELDNLNMLRCAKQVCRIHSCILS